MSVVEFASRHVNNPARSREVSFESPPPPTPPTSIEDYRDRKIAKRQAKEFADLVFDNITMASMMGRDLFLIDTDMDYYDSGLEVIDKKIRRDVDPQQYMETDEAGEARVSVYQCISPSDVLLVKKERGIPDEKGALIHEEWFGRQNTELVVPMPTWEPPNVVHLDFKKTS